MLFWNFLYIKVGNLETYIAQICSYLHAFFFQKDVGNVDVDSRGYVTSFL